MTTALSAHQQDFAPDLLAVQENPPARLPRAVGYVAAALFVGLGCWAVFGQLDVVASAEGRLVPRNLSRVVQPAESGVVREVLVREGEEVRAGQVLLRMDATTASADLDTLQRDLALKALTLRRIEAELSGNSFATTPADPAEVAQVLAQYLARRRAQEDALAQERATLERAQHDLSAARQSLDRLVATVPLYRKQANSYEKLVKEGYVSELGANDKIRELIEKEQELKSQQSIVAGLDSAVDQSRKKLAQIASNYQSQLHNERVELLATNQKVLGELNKQNYKSGLLELRSPATGLVKDLAAYTPGAVVQPGMVLLNIVPKGEALMAEVAIKNEDAGFVTPGQAVKVKLQAYPFQKYGMLDGVVEVLGADSSVNDPQKAAVMGQSPQSYKLLVKLSSQELRSPAGDLLKLSPGMVVTAEVNQGQRSVLEYLLSPVQKISSEAARER